MSRTVVFVGYDRVVPEFANAKTSASYRLEHFAVGTNAPTQGGERLI